MSSTREFEKISLENFDPLSSKEPILSSPRSLEACRRQGIEPWEIVEKTYYDIKQLYGHMDLDKEGLEILVEHYEQKRQEKVKILLKERETIISEERQGRFDYLKPKVESKRDLSETSSNKKLSLNTILNTKTDSTMVEREKKQLEKIKLRQEKELKHMIEYEAKMSEVKKAQEEKFEKEREREKRREREMATKLKEAEEKKRALELEKFKKEEEEEELKRRLLAEAYKREQEFLEREREKQRQRELESKIREEEQRRKHEEFVKKTEEKLLEQKMVIEKKKEEMEAKDKARVEYLQEQALLKQKETEEKRKEHEEKLKIAKEKFDETLTLKKKEFEEKQKKNEEKRKLFEKEIERKKEEAKKKAELHEIKLQQVLDENKKIEEEKKRYYQMREELAEERRRELEAIAEQERQRKLQEEIEREEKRKQIKQNMETMHKEKINAFLESMAEGEMRLARVQEQKEQELKLKHNMDIINKIDKLENVNRMNKIKAYQQEKLEEKIAIDLEKAEKIKQDREELLTVRKSIRREMFLSKKNLAEKFERVKLGKLDPIEFSLELTKGFSKGGSPPASLTSLDGKMDDSENKPMSSIFYTPQAKRKVESLARIPNSEDKKSSIVTKSIQSLPTLDMYIRKPRNIRITKVTKPAQNVDPKAQFEKIKARQYDEMAKILEEEREKEKRRESELIYVVDPERRKHLEKTFKVERGMASARIEHLAGTHEVQLKQAALKYGLKENRGKI